MHTTVLNEKTFSQLDKDDQEKIQYFIQLLLRQSKYEKLKGEIAQRREEIAKGEVLTHKEIWDEVNV